MKKSILCVGALCMGLWASAENIEVKSFRYAGPYAVHQPYMIDTVDVNSKAFAMKKFLDTPLSFESLKVGTSYSGEVLPATDGNALHLLENRFLATKEGFLACGQAGSRLLCATGT